MLSIGQHLTLMLLAEFGAFALGGYLGLWGGGLLIVALGHSPDGDFVWLWWLFALSGAFICLYSIVTLFHKRIPARCRHRFCRGAAYVCSTTPYTYACEYCGHQVESRWTTET